MMCLRPLKYFLVWQEVTGRVQRIITKTLMLGKAKDPGKCSGETLADFHLV